MASKEDATKAFTEANKSLRQGIQECADILKRINLSDEDLYRFILDVSAKDADLICHRGCRIV